MVRVHVPEPGNEKLPLPVQPGYPARDVDSVADGRDPVALNQHANPSLVRSVGDVDDCNICDC